MYRLILGWLWGMVKYGLFVKLVLCGMLFLLLIVMLFFVLSM